MLQLGRSVPPRPIVAGEPLLTMRCVSSLEELAPWFSTLSLSLTRQQTRSLASSHTRPDTCRWVSQCSSTHYPPQRSHNNSKSNISVGGYLEMYFV